MKVLNMVYANKEERRQEKQLKDFIIGKVLNTGNLTKINGITTKDDLEKQAERDRMQKMFIAQEQADKELAELNSKCGISEVSLKPNY